MEFGSATADSDDAAGHDDDDGDVDAHDDSDEAADPADDDANVDADDDDADAADGGTDAMDIDPAQLRALEHERGSPWRSSSRPSKSPSSRSL